MVKYILRPIIASMEYLDLKGKVCPFVLFYTKKKLESVPKGEKLEVLSDDPIARETISDWCRTHHHDIMEIEQNGALLKITILKH